MTVKVTEFIDLDFFLHLRKLISCKWDENPTLFAFHHVDVIALFVTL